MGFLYKKERRNEKLIFMITNKVHLNGYRLLRVFHFSIQKVRKNLVPFSLYFISFALSCMSNTKKFAQENWKETEKL